MTAQSSIPMPEEAKIAYDARWRRFMDCVELKTPDRMPIAMFCTFWLAKYGGVSCRQLMYDFDKIKEVGERAILEFEPDVYHPWMLTVPVGPALEALDYKQLLWPGHGVGDNQPYQYLDREYMSSCGIQRICRRSHTVLFTEIPAARCGCLRRFRGISGSSRPALFSSYRRHPIVRAAEDARRA